MRELLVVADDYGIGMSTSKGILRLAHQGLLSATLLLVNSPHAAPAVQLWRASGRPLMLGWHPCLTLDAPVLPPEEVPSLVRTDGQFPPLGDFLHRWLFGRLSRDELYAELSAQCARFKELVGHWPAMIAAHHHLQVFPPVGQVLLDVLETIRPRPYVRRLHKPWSQLLGIPGGRFKRFLLSRLGTRFADEQERRGFPGHDTLVGVTDPKSTLSLDFFPRCLAHAKAERVELTCHPGFNDPALIGRDDAGGPIDRVRRIYELRGLLQPQFQQAALQQGFKIVSTSSAQEPIDVPLAHAA